MERRASIQGEVRSEGRTLSGYALVYGSEARINGHREIIAPGAVTASLGGGRDILALVDHDAGKLLGRTKSGSLRLSEDSRGLAFEIDLPETSAARDVLALVERGDAGGMSFGFSTPKGGDEWRGTTRTLRNIHLHEISVVQSFPAYTATTVEARNAAFALDLMRLRLEAYR
ncbi:MAG: HK97 family phage prohead protease [Sphingomicrobium sp.]